MPLVFPEFNNSSTLSGLRPSINHTFSTTLEILDAEFNFRKIPPVTSCCLSCSPDIGIFEFQIRTSSEFGSEGGAESKPSVSPKRKMQ